MHVMTYIIIVSHLMCNVAHESIGSLELITSSVNLHCSLLAIPYDIIDLLRLHGYSILCPLGHVFAPGRLGENEDHGL